MRLIGWATGSRNSQNKRFARLGGKSPGPYRAHTRLADEHDASLDVVKYQSRKQFFFLTALMRTSEAPFREDESHSVVFASVQSICTYVYMYISEALPACFGTGVQRADPALQFKRFKQFWHPSKNANPGPVACYIQPFYFVSGKHHRISLNMTGQRYNASFRSRVEICSFAFQPFPQPPFLRYTRLRLGKTNGMQEKIL